MVMIYLDSTNLFYFGSQLIYLLMGANLVEIKIINTDKKEKYNILVPGKFIYDKIGKFILLSIPNKIPMVVKPKKFIREIINGKVTDKLGGYLLNDVHYTSGIIIENRELKTPSLIEINNKIYDMVNNMSAVGYKINISVLDFVLEFGLDYNLVIDPNYIHPLSLKSKLTILERRELESFQSQQQLEMNILGLALIFRNVPEFFIPVRIDNRGRLYCISDYLNYQSIELAKALLLFSKEDKISVKNIEAINFLKIFGANCYGRGLDKKSFKDRIK
jgi:DNA-directed RNA polymerase